MTKVLMLIFGALVLTSYIMTIQGKAWYDTKTCILDGEYCDMTSFYGWNCCPPATCKVSKSRCCSKRDPVTKALSEDYTNKAKRVQKKPELGNAYKSIPTNNGNRAGYSIVGPRHLEEGGGGGAVPAAGGFECFTPEERILEAFRRETGFLRRGERNWSFVLGNSSLKSSRKRADCRPNRQSPRGPVVVLSAGGGGGGGGGGCSRRREFERRGSGGRGTPCVATISSSVAGSAGGCGPVVGLPSYKKRQGGGASWGRGGRGRGRGRGGGGSTLLGPGAAPANYPPGLQGVGPGFREVVNILGERNQSGTLTGVGPPPGASDNEEAEDEEEGTAPKRPPRPLYRRFINYVRQAWTGVKFALDSEYEEEQTPRYRPDSLASLCRATRFTEAELKRIYRGFKAECPTGVVREDTFKCIYSQFFPQGANTSQYAHYVFNTLDQDHSGLLSFEDFVTGLSILSRGSMDEKLRWTFSLYDINGDGCITRDEMTDIVTAVYELMGKFSDPNMNHDGVRQKVDRLFQKMDGNKDGVVTLSEFLEACRADPDISTSMAALDTAF